MPLINNTPVKPFSATAFHNGRLIPVSQPQA